MDQFNLQADAVQVENAPTYAVVGKKAAEEFRMTGRTNGGFAILDKDKVTFGGVCFVKKIREFRAQRINWITSVDEIRGCSYIRRRSVYHIILAPLFLLFAIVALILFWRYCSESQRLPFVSDATALSGFLGLLGLLAFPFLCVNAILRFVRSCRTFFEIQLDGISFCYDTRYLEKDEEIPFRLAVQKNKISQRNRSTYPQ